MKIMVREIPPQGLVIDQSVAPGELGLSDEELLCQSSIAVKASIEKTAGAVLAETEFRGKFSLVCARCLEPVEQEIIRQCRFNYELDNRTEFIDLGEDIRQEMVLAFSPIVVCRTDCKGLCPGCGKNLNKEECQCQKTAKEREM